MYPKLHWWWCKNASSWRVPQYLHEEVMLCNTLHTVVQSPTNCMKGFRFQLSVRLVPFEASWCPSKCISFAELYAVLRLAFTPFYYSQLFTSVGISAWLRPESTCAGVRTTKTCRSGVNQLLKRTNTQCYSKKAIGRWPIMVGKDRAP